MFYVRPLSRRLLHLIAHRTSLGWAVVGDICPFDHHTNDGRVKTLRTSVVLDHDHFTAAPAFSPVEKTDIFIEKYDDDAPGLSSKVNKFLMTLNKVKINTSRKLETPLPLRNEFFAFPDNKEAVHRRENNTLRRLRRDPVKLGRCLKVMEKYLASGHVEAVPDCELSGEPHKTWFLPVFPVTHHKKKKTRLVFDSSASYHNVSLNAQLIQGPDQNNSLRAVLTRFREGPIGFIADVEQMFHSFFVEPQHINLMKFFWFKDNHPDNKLSQFRAKVHVFGNCSSPAVATFCLRKAAEIGKDEKLPQTRLCNSTQQSEIIKKAQNYIARNFYVDDGLGTANSVDEAIAVIEASRALLARTNIRLHKIMCTDNDVTNAFPPTERAHKQEEFAFNDENTQRALGVAWNTTTDAFVMKIDISPKPFTRRGLLSTVNSIFDPLGIAAPVTLTGRLLQREILGSNENEQKNQSSDSYWDDPLGALHRDPWERWLSALKQLSTLSLPRSFVPPNFDASPERNLHVFSDASDNAIGSVIYLQCVSNSGTSSVSFVHGSSRVAPKGATSIPRLELCAAVEAVLYAQQILRDLTTPPSSVSYYTDSQVVLGYIRNEEKRFSRYVSHRVGVIHRASDPSQWHYIETGSNPADVATRSHDPISLRKTSWLSGPEFLRNPACSSPTEDIDQLPLEELPETVNPSSAKALFSMKEDSNTFCDLVQRTNSLEKIIRVTQLIFRFVWYSSDAAKQRLGTSLACRNGLPTRSAAIAILIEEAQASEFGSLMNLLRSAQEIPPRHPLAGLAPFLSTDGLLRVGGRLKRSDFPLDRKHPILLPKNHRISDIILLHYHQLTGHQGRHVTHGALRDAGYHILGGRQKIRSLLSQCVLCRRHRAACEQPYMSDLPRDRMETSAPFTNIGLDVFGPWDIRERTSTRRSSGQKCWAIIFTCLSSRAVHVDALPSMDTPSFINALRRFMSLRGPCKLIRSDRGTNFVGARNQGNDVSLEKVNKFLKAKDCIWELNPPHASHFGGVWERKIGQIRRALEGAMLQTGPRCLSRDELFTLLQEAAAVVNNTPLWVVSDDPNDAQPLARG